MVQWVLVKHSSDPAFHLHFRGPAGMCIPAHATAIAEVKNISETLLCFWLFPTLLTPEKITEKLKIRHVVIVPAQDTSETGDVLCPSSIT